eukprot:5841282-Amphidinium_carterae.2
MESVETVVAQNAILHVFEAGHQTHIYCIKNVETLLVLGLEPGDCSWTCVSLYGGDLDAACMCACRNSSSSLSEMLERNSYPCGFLVEVKGCEVSVGPTCVFGRPVKVGCSRSNQGVAIGDEEDSQRSPLQSRNLPVPWQCF